LNAISHSFFAAFFLNDWACHTQYYAKTILPSPECVTTAAASQPAGLSQSRKCHCEEGVFCPTKQSPGSKGDCFGLETASSPRTCACGTGAGNDTTWLDLSSYFVKILSQPAGLPGYGCTGEGMLRWIPAVFG
jgi:hypothetical protein